MKIIFYGDSNTYGFDPRGYSGGRYDVKDIWTVLVQEMLGSGWQVINEGMNGRRLPAGDYASAYMEELFASLSPEDFFAVMLGTNDLLVSMEPDARKPVRRMEELLERLTNKADGPRLLIIAPPYIGGRECPGTDPLMAGYFEESVRMNEGFRCLAERYGVMFADAAKWGIELAYDDVHFSENGHRMFAVHISEVLRKAGSK